MMTHDTVTHEAGRDNDGNGTWHMVHSTLPSLVRSPLSLLVSLCSLSFNRDTIALKRGSSFIFHVDIFTFF